MDVLIVLIRFEPESVGIGKEYQAKEQEDNDKAERGMGNHFGPRTPQNVAGQAGEEHKGFSTIFFVIFAYFAVKELK